MKKLFLVIVMLIALVQTAWGQGQTRAQGSAWRRNTAIVLFSGIGGSILGLSTLSFYGDPKEHTNNITTGAALGLLAGVGFIVYENTPRSAPIRRNDYYGLFQPAEQIKRPTLASVPSVQFEFTF